MKQLKNIIVAASFLLSGHQYTYGQSELDSISFNIDVPENVSFQYPVLGSRLFKASGHQLGTIEVNVDSTEFSSLSTEKKAIIEASIKSAVNIWSLYLNGNHLKISIRLSQNISHDIETLVYYNSPQNDDTSYPLSYCRNYLESNSYNDFKDAIITINSQTDWEIGYDGQKHNLTLGLLRAIAHSLGFGTSLTLSTNGTFVIRATAQYTAFDKLVFSSSGQYLKDIPARSTNSNSALNIFANPQSNNMYVYYQTPQYQLYAPSVFDNYASFRYFNDNNSIMSYNTHSGMEANVDTLTLRLINEVGWGFDIPQQAKIISTDIDSTGYASAYSSHHFVLSGVADNLDSYEWKYRLPLKNGTMQVVTTSNTEDFTIPTVNNDSIYQISDNREIVGEILFSGYKNQLLITASYLIRLQLKPHILGIEVLDKEWNEYSEDYYSLTVGVQYEGCFYVYTSLEEEYGIWEITQVSYDPYFSRITYDNIDSWGSAWLTVIARNNYGTDTKTIEIPCPQDFGLSRDVTHIYGKCNTPSEMEVFTLSGFFIGKVENYEKLSSLCKKGQTYIIKESGENKISKPIKYTQK